MLARGLLRSPERSRFEQRVSECEVCRHELTRLIDDRPAEDHARPRRFPWVPTVAAATVLLAVSIAYFLGGRQRYLELSEPGSVLAVEGAVAMRREGSPRRLSLRLGEWLQRGDRIRTPEGASLLILSARGELQRFDIAGETKLLHLGKGVALGSVTERVGEIEELLASAPSAVPPQAQAPRGKVLSQRPLFEVASVDGSVRFEIRDETGGIRLRWDTNQARSPFPPSGRSLERGRSFFWKAAGMRDEQAFFVASEDDIAEWQSFRARLYSHTPSPAARAILEASYLRNRGYHLDALGVLRKLVEARTECRMAARGTRVGARSTRPTRSCPHPRRESEAHRRVG